MEVEKSHQMLWVDLLKGIEATSWFDLIHLLFHKNHGYSNYKNCLKRDHIQIKEQVFHDEKVKQYLKLDDSNKKKVDKILNEMSHLLSVQSNPSRKLKVAGLPFLRCITKVYSSIYVNSSLSSSGTSDIQNASNVFKEQYLKLSKDMPIVILPTHRSYMDFLFITYIMFTNELPLPCVAAGDNFKAMGSILLDYLKGTGAFLVRRNAANKKDIQPAAYYDILRAYVQSVLTGGENPLEFFMEGTRTRGGQVLKPKTGLLSMVVEWFLEGNVEDLCMMPVSISYQRPIEEQLYIAENTPEIDMVKPKENAKNLIAAMETIMKRKYGNVYVRFIEPFKLSEFVSKWKKSMKVDDKINLKDSSLHQITNCLASKVCLSQAYNNILMPFSLMTYSILSRSFLRNMLDKSESRVERTKATSLSFSVVAQDFQLIEDSLIKTQPQFLPGWKSHVDLVDEFKLDRDGIIRSSDDRRLIEFNNDAMTFHTMLYYSNQLMQIFLPLALCSVARESKVNPQQLYQTFRKLLSHEFLWDESSSVEEYKNSNAAIERHDLSHQTKEMMINHLVYFIRCYLIFLNYLKVNIKMNKDDFFNREVCDKEHLIYISKDMIKNMFMLVKEEKVVKSIVIEKKHSIESKKSSGRSSRTLYDETLELEDEAKLGELIDTFQQVLDLCSSVMSKNNS